MRAALATSSTPDLVVAHAPGTRRGDAAELAALQAVFAQGVPEVTSLKWATGHTFGASGPLALAGALQMMEHGTAVGLPYGKPAGGRRPKAVLTNATGFGGNAVSVVVEQPVVAAG